MKREIKFRAWYNNKKVMAYCDKDAEFDVEYWDGVLSSKIEMLNAMASDSDIEIMQYTGLKDKSGKEIYEGDIINAHNLIGVVTWHNELALFEIIVKEKGMPDGSITLYSKQEEDINLFREVIGNIYENKDLLAQGD